MSLLVKCVSFPEMAPPKAPLYLPLPEVAPELLEVVKGQASPMLEMAHLVKVSPQKGSRGPQHPHHPYPGTAPIIYPKTLQQLLTGPESNLSEGPGVGSGYRKQKP